MFLAFPVTQLVKNLPAMWETLVQFLGWENPLETGKAGYPLQYSGLENSMEESMESQRVGHNWMTFTSHQSYLFGIENSGNPLHHSYLRDNSSNAFLHTNNINQALTRTFPVWFPTLLTVIKSLILCLRIHNAGILNEAYSVMFIFFTNLGLKPLRATYWHI